MREWYENPDQAEVDQASEVARRLFDKSIEAIKTASEKHRSSKVFTINLPDPEIQNDVSLPEDLIAEFNQKLVDA
ncbi:hypothetical protein COT78_03960 [Candidatus Berkelbacteria bacterium CG10_big_fil_rev_8_21_14_0_10_43_13]|uniref:Uncharacterized protein n=1 Tax=Candidatus Berkelbacteria bacterium CG10_big_fil_rev_8_21_14_0_10_43_13 TaxID=1974514 RepID=A0A2H0W5K4_9BACT|nr:MAG: hypothetical protein COT78_03960 [Candidatus Berkelbacteria bacterium CG10_big_fil_rev_8_21_14_0_10_43_13]